MKIFKEYDTGKALCPKCGLVSVTYQVSTVPFSDGKGEVSGILAGVCGQCNQVAVIPQQSVPRIRAVRQAQREALEVRLPVHVLDMLCVAADKLGGRSFLDAEKLLKLYVHYLVMRKREAKALGKLLESDLASGKATARLSLKVSSEFKHEFKMLKQMANFRQNTQLVKALAMKCHQDSLAPKEQWVNTEIGRLFSAMQVAS